MSSIATEAGMGAVTATHRRRYMERKSLVPLLLFLPPALILFKVEQS